MLIQEIANPEDLRALLDSEPSEHQISKFLAKYPWTIYWTFCVSGGHRKYLFREFALGEKYKADYVLVHTNSSGFYVSFIELKPVDDIVFTKSRTPSRALSTAIRQVCDWKEYAQKNHYAFREALLRGAKTKNLLAKKGNVTLGAEYAEHELLIANAHIYIDCHIVIGRRDVTSPENQLMKNRFQQDHKIELLSYDRFLDVASEKKSSKSMNL